MIEYLRGSVLLKESGHVVLDVNGVGYGLDVPATTLARLPGRGEEAELFTYLYVQEQVLRLYGFMTEQERDVFEVFLGTSGIGPKTAISILSSIEIEDFAHAILRQDLHTLTKLPGIGKKTAERLIVELRDKVAVFATDTSKASAQQGVPVGVPATAIEDTARALEALGCKPGIAVRAAQKAAEMLGADATIEELIREALKYRR